MNHTPPSFPPDCEPAAAIREGARTYLATYYIPMRPFVYALVIDGAPDNMRGAPHTEIYSFNNWLKCLYYADVASEMCEYQATHPSVKRAAAQYADKIDEFKRRMAELEQKHRG